MTTVDQVVDVTDGMNMLLCSSYASLIGHAGLRLSKGGTVEVLFLFLDYCFATSLPARLDRYVGRQPLKWRVLQIHPPPPSRGTNCTGIVLRYRTGETKKKQKQNGT